MVDPPEEFYLTVTTSYSTPTGEGFYYENNLAYAGVAAGIVSGGTGIRWVFDYWSDAATGTNYAQSNGINMTANMTATANWQLQYFLDVISPYSTTTGDGWYDVDSEAHAGVVA
ncbi:unnamed protein product, partial [marine sediment metagenome]